MTDSFVPPWQLEVASVAGHTRQAMSSDEMHQLLKFNNIGFTSKDMPHGRQFRLSDGAIANVYSTGKIVWQGKDLPTAERVKGLCGGEMAAPVAAPKGHATVSLSNNKVFIVYGHDTDAREQLELLLRRMKLEPVILQNLPIGGDTIIEKLEANVDVRYACVLLRGRLETRLWGGWPGSDVIPNGCRSLWSLSCGRRPPGGSIAAIICATEAI